VLARVLALLGALAGALLLAPGPACGRAADIVRPKHVILVVVDTLRADRLGCYGYPRDTSPHLDALAAEGALYLNHRAQGSWTRPSMISMMSGSYVFAPEEVLPAALPTLAERVRASGRRTAAFVGNALLTGDRGFQRGFDHFEALAPLPRAGRAAAMFRRFYDWVGRERDSIESGPGLFVWLHVMDPHAPRRPEPHHAALFTGDPPGLPELLARWRAADGDPGRLPDVPGERDFDAAVAEIVKEQNLYDGEVRSADEELGRLVDFLRDEGLWEDTLLIVASDHGEQLWERPVAPESLRLFLSRAAPLGGLTDRFDVGHGMSLYDEAWRTPFVMRGPGVPAGVREERLSCNLDIVPTVLEACGLPVPRELPGRSLFGGRAPRHDVVFGYSHHRVGAVDARGMKYVDASAWRASLDASLTDPAADGPAEALHDLAADPGETADLGPVRPEELLRFRRLVEDWRRHSARPIDDTLSSRDRRALLELGYVEGG
jgi:arylsulfatase A-like enzyme